MQETVKQRLGIFIKNKMISQKRFEEMVGLSNGYVNNISKGIGGAKLQKILETFPELSQRWLLTGEGDMLVSDVKPVEAAEVKDVTVNSHGVKFIQTSSGLRVEVPIVPFKAMGSPIDEFAQLIRDNGHETVAFPADAFHHGNYLAFRVEGDSMDDGSRNGFQPGDIVLVRELDKQDWAPRLHFAKWPFWVIAWGNCVRLKQIIDQSEDGKTITCHSLNPSPEFTDFTLPLSTVNRLFNVIQVQPKPRIF